MLQESFEHFINVRQNKPAELVAKYIDTKLRATTKARIVISIVISRN